MLRARENSAALALALRSTLSSLDPSLPLSSFQSMEFYVDASLAPRKFNLVLLGIFAALAIALAAAGLYGTMSYLVNQRTNEIGIRMALGARQPDVLRMVVGNGLALSAIGVALGLVASLTSTQVLASLVFGVDSLDPLVFGVAPLVLTAIAALASYIPARRAARIDPLAALRME
jgi:putative ABC transport system permease protein